MIVLFAMPDLRGEPLDAVFPDPDSPDLLLHVVSRAGEVEPSAVEREDGHVLVLEARRRE
jgi:hypothetical protein